MVKGTIFNETGKETGVVVNGRAATVIGNNFVANHVLLEEGQNTITAVASDTNGFSVEASINLNAETIGDFIRIIADDYTGVSGTSPFETRLRVEGSFSFPTGYTITYTGPDEVEFLEGEEENESIIRITTLGTYIFKAEARDEEANLHEDSISIVVLDKAQLDVLLRAKWDAMKTALGNQDIEKALEYYIQESREKYREIYSIIYNKLPQLVQGMQDIELLHTDGVGAKYCIIRNQIYAGQMYPIAYYIYFVRDVDGLWKIYWF